MRLWGASNEFFSCYFTGEGSFDISLRFTFKNDINAEFMKKAATEAMRLFPELDIKPVIKDNKVQAVRNGGEVVFADDPDKIMCLGSEDTNGFMLFFVCTGKELKVVIYHGLTDAHGLTQYLKSMFTIYLGYIGEKVTDEDFLSAVRTPDSPKLNPNEDDMYDPYRLYGNAEAVPEYRFENPGALAIPMELYPPSENHIHEFLVDISTSEFIAMTKKLGVSFVPLIIDIVANTVFNNYDTGDDPFIAMLPVNMRPFFGSSTAVNFSDGISLPVYKEDADLDMAERCRKTRDIMKKQITRANFESIIANKTAAVERYYEDKSDILTRKPPLNTRGKGTLSLPVTYPGKVSFGESIDGLIEGVAFSGGARVNSIIISTFGDKMEFAFDWRSDDDTFIVRFCDELKKYGFSPVMKDNGYIVRNLFLLDKLERIGG